MLIIFILFIYIIYYPKKRPYKFYKHNIQVLIIHAEIVEEKIGRLDGRN